MDKAIFDSLCQALQTYEINFEWEGRGHSKDTYIIKDKESGKWGTEKLSKSDKRYGAKHRALDLDKVVREIERDLEAYLSEGGKINQQQEQYIRKAIKNLKANYDAGRGWFSKKQKVTEEAFRHVFSFLDTASLLTNVLNEKVQGQTPHTTEEKEVFAKTDTTSLLYPRIETQPESQYSDYVDYGSLPLQQPPLPVTEQKKLFQACKEGNLDTLKEMVMKDRRCLNTSTVEDGSLLHAACATGQKEVAAYLIQQNPALLGRPDLEGRLPLAIAEEKKNPDFISFMKRQMKFLADLMGDLKVNKEINREIVNMLFYACQKGDFYTLKSILEQKPEYINAMTDSIYPPESVTLLHCAARERNSWRIIEYLVNKKPSLLNYPSSANNTPLPYRDIYVDQIEQYLVKRGGSTTPVYEWKILNDLELEKNLKNPDRHQLLLACREGNLEKLQEFFKTADATKRDIYLSTTDSDGRSLLHIACAHGNRDIASFLLKQRRGMIDLRDLKGRTPLHAAAEANEGKLVSFLLAKHADINALDNKSFSPLHAALESGQDHIFEYLLKRGSKISPPNKQKNNFAHLVALMPIGTAAKRDLGETLIIEKNAAGQTPLHLYIATHKVPDVNWNDIKALTGSGVSLRVTDKNSKTPLHYLLESVSGQNLPQEDVIQINRLIKEAYEINPKSINIATNVSKTLLHIAIESKLPLAIIDQLIKCGANQKARDGNGLTPLELAKKLGSADSTIKALEKGI